MDDVVVTLLRRTLEIRAEDVDDDHVAALPGDRRPPQPSPAAAPTSPPRLGRLPAAHRSSRRRPATRLGGAAIVVALVGIGVGGLLAGGRIGRPAGRQPATGAAAPPAAALPTAAAPATAGVPDPADDVAWVLPVALPPDWELTEIAAVEHVDSPGGRPTSRRHFVRTDSDGEVVAELIAGVQPVWSTTEPLTVTTTVRGLDAEVYVQPADEVRRGMLPLTMVRWFDDGLEVMVFGHGLSADEVLSVAERTVLRDGTLTIDPAATGLGGFVDAIGVESITPTESSDARSEKSGVTTDIGAADTDEPIQPAPAHTVWLTARSTSGASASPIVIAATPAAGGLDEHLHEQETPESYRRTIDGIEYFVRPAVDESIGPHTFLMWAADGYVYSWSGPLEATAALHFAAVRPASRSEAAIAATELAHRTMELPVRATAQFADGLAADVRGTPDTAGPVALCVVTEPPRCLRPTADSGAGGRGESQIADVFFVDGRRLVIGWVADDPGDVHAADGTPVEVVAAEEGWFLLAELDADVPVPRFVVGDGSDAYTLLSPGEQLRP